MNQDLQREVRRWMEADRAGRDEEGDAAFRALFRALPEPAARPGFADRVMEALARDAARRRRRARIAAACGIAASILVALGVVVALVAQGPKLLVAAVDVSIAVALWISAAFENGLDLWEILGQMGGAAASVLATPQVTSVLIAIEAIGAAALYGLHRILTSEQESSR